MTSPQLVPTHNPNSLQWDAPNFSNLYTEPEVPRHITSEPGHPIYGGQKFSSFGSLSQRNSPKLHGYPHSDSFGFSSAGSTALSSPVSGMGPFEDEELLPPLAKSRTASFGSLSSSLRPYSSDMGGRTPTALLIQNLPRDLSRREAFLMFSCVPEFLSCELNASAALGTDNIPVSTSIVANFSSRQAAQAALSTLERRGNLFNDPSLFPSPRGPWPLAMQLISSNPGGSAGIPASSARSQKSKFSFANGDDISPTASSASVADLSAGQASSSTSNSASLPLCVPHDGSHFPPLAHSQHLHMGPSPLPVAGGTPGTSGPSHGAPVPPNGPNQVYPKSPPSQGVYNSATTLSSTLNALNLGSDGNTRSQLVSPFLSGHTHLSNTNSSALETEDEVLVSHHGAPNNARKVPARRSSAPGQGTTNNDDPSNVIMTYTPTTSAKALCVLQNGGRVLPPANPADQNPPCNTLYVGNLPPDTLEGELKDLFSVRPGYKRLCFRSKANGPMCFVEFENETYAGMALEELYGRGLSNSVKGGIRLSFSKNPLGVRANRPRAT